MEERLFALGKLEQDSQGLVTDTAPRPVSSLRPCPAHREQQQGLLDS